MIKIDRPERVSEGRVKSTGYSRLVLATLVLSIASLVIEQTPQIYTRTALFVHILDFTILFLFIIETVLDFSRAAVKRAFLRSNLFNLIFLFLFTLLFTYNKLILFSGQSFLYGQLPMMIIVIRSLFVLFKVFGRIRKLSAFLKTISAQPARTVIISFALAILAGTILLMQPFSTVGLSRLGFIDSLFTATSAVCVTGLIVVDTATAFSLWGKLIVVALIQIGGLGIMILSYFLVFMFRRSISLEDKALLSYMLSEKDMSNLNRSLRNIIYLTFAIEAAGAVLLFFAFGGPLGWNADAVFTSVFHSISAFCNAGFSVFSDSLEKYKSNLPVNIIICTLIICGGISFAVLLDLIRFIKGKLFNLLSKQKRRITTLSPNTRIVIIGTGVLIFLGMLFLYGTEHRNTLLRLDLGTQYYAAFFQSVTLRTAGFNTINMSQLTTSSLLFMIILMFIGAASGSTAGGIKINTVGVLIAYVRSAIRERQDVTLFTHSIAKEVVFKAFLILLFGIIAVMAGTLLLTLTEQASFIHIFFEAVSAFATVGLSAGLTPHLTVAGKVIIILLMFTGRLGPLTLLAAATKRAHGYQISFPRADIMLG
ncbi:MAG TPA: TrkH family potassium uptake protein [Spirochaetia bacterium]|nr:TrkH family potassium uptake protein [Spirochaetia bacterium]